jgi:hypothetical protein
MGRYAFFNTGFEYKFTFAVQESQDILTFGGDYNMDDDGPSIEWVADEDLTGILEKLRAIEEGPAIDFEKFSKNLDGTHDLMDHLWDLSKEAADGAFHARYRLGCLIYHQLLYTPELSADFEF